MSHKKIGYSIHGYRYAPQRFRIYYNTQSGHEVQIPLSDEQRSQIGYLYLAQGEKAALENVKCIDQERSRKCLLYMAYGFLTQDAPSNMFIKQFRFHEDTSVGKRLKAYRELKDYLAQIGGKVKVGSCQLYGHYRPVDVMEHYLTEDFERPIIIWLEIV